MGIDDARNRLTILLSACCFAAQIPVLAEQHPTEGSGPVEQLRIGKLRCIILSGCQHIHAAGTQTLGDSLVDVVIHVQGQRHLRSPASRSRLATGESADWARCSSTSFTSRATCASSSA